MRQAIATALAVFIYWNVNGTAFLGKVVNENADFYLVIPCGVFNEKLRPDYKQFIKKGPGVMETTDTCPE